MEQRKLEDLKKMLCKVTVGDTVDKMFNTKNPREIITREIINSIYTRDGSIRFSLIIDELNMRGHKDIADGLESYRDMIINAKLPETVVRKALQGLGGGDEIDR